MKTIIKNLSIVCWYDLYVSILFSSHFHQYKVFNHNWKLPFMRHDGKYNALIKQTIITTNSLLKILLFLSKLCFISLVKRNILNFRNYELCNFLEQIKLAKTISTSYRMVRSAIWQIFSKFLIFCNLFYKPLAWYC